MDKQRFVSLIDAYNGHLYHIAQTMLVSHEDVKDTMQETAICA